jgi:hypothetical protein
MPHKFPHSFINGPAAISEKKINRAVIAGFDAL